MEGIEQRIPGGKTQSKGSAPISPLVHLLRSRMLFCLAECVFCSPEGHRVCLTEWNSLQPLVMLPELPHKRLLFYGLSP